MDESKKKPDEEKQNVALTRREWLMSLGSAVVLSGLPGQARQDAQGVGVVRPPGLHQPSFDHLAHALAGEEPFLPIPRGTETEYLRPRSGPFQPRAFAQDEFHLVRRLVEIILGEDLRNSSGAQRGQAGIYDEVAEWIDLVVASAPRIRTLSQNLPADQRALTVAYLGGEEPLRELETFEPESVCHDGLAWLNDESQRRLGKRFIDADPAEQVELVRATSDIRPDKSTIHAGIRLFNFLKAESIRGFYTSRIGLKELDYKGNAFYGKSPGCGLTPKSLVSTRKPE
jgi:hypothetical protein